MSGLIRNVALGCGVGVLSVAAVASPGTAAAFYDLEFSRVDGTSAGTGELIRAEEPFEGTVERCVAPETPFCDSIPLEIKAEDGFFLVESFSTTVPGLTAFSQSAENRFLFWREDETRLAGLSFCPYSSCFFRLDYSPDSWYFDARTAFRARMTANEWEVNSFIPEIESGSGTWTATRRASVPEPASTLGLMALGALGVSRLKRDRG